MWNIEDFLYFLGIYKERKGGPFIETPHFLLMANQCQCRLYFKHEGYSNLAKQSHLECPNLKVLQFLFKQSLDTRQLFLHSSPHLDSRTIPCPPYSNPWGTVFRGSPWHQQIVLLEVMFFPWQRVRFLACSPRDSWRSNSHRHSRHSLLVRSRPHWGELGSCKSPLGKGHLKPGPRGP